MPTSDRMITRRQLLGLVALGAWSSASFAQQPDKIWRIGFLAPYSRDSAPGANRLASFVRGLHELGYVEGKNYLIEFRSAGENDERLAALAAELVGLKVDVILAAASPAIRAAKRATSTIPIVMGTTGDPVGSGFVASLRRPGGNVTGMSNMNLDVSGKLFELLSVIVPGLSRVAVLGDPGSSTYPAMAKSIDAAAQTANLLAVHFTARTIPELEKAFLAMSKQRVEALVIPTSPFLTSHVAALAALAAARRLPSISQGREYAEAGGLMSYGSNFNESFHRAAAYVDKIFKGATPGDLPVEQPTKLELVINRRVAGTFGLSIPQGLLLRADEVIE